MMASSTAIVTCGFRARDMVFRHIAAVRPQVAILAITLKQFDRKRAHVGFAGIEQPHPALGLKRRAFVERGGAASPRFDGDERRISRSAPYAQVVKAVKRQPHAVAAQCAHQRESPCQRYSVPASCKLTSWAPKGSTHAAMSSRTSLTGDVPAGAGQFWSDVMRASFSRTYQKCAQ